MRLTALLEEVGLGERGRPASICILSGDVHHAYLAEAAFRRDANVSSAVYQAVCSPYRKALDAHERLAVRPVIRAPPKSSSAPSPEPRGSRIPTSGGASPAVRTSTTR